MAENGLKTMIEAKGLCKYYGHFVAIKDISFSIQEGQIVAFLGPNGAGKTTTMKILTGYLGASSGEAKIAGYCINSERLETAKRIGYLPENGPLYEDMTPKELLLFFAEARGIDENKRLERIADVVVRTSLQEVLDKPIDKLSRGYRQRVGLAQALLHDPDVLIMDEPTLGLDPNQIRDFRNNIKALGKSKTILISTHILQEVDAIADRVIVINKGLVVFDGTPKELKAKSSIEEEFYKLTNYGNDDVIKTPELENEVEGK